MRLIPGKTKVRLEIFKGVGIVDLLIGLAGALVAVFILMSTLPNKFIFICIVLGITIFLIVRFDDEPNYVFLRHMVRHFGYPHYLTKLDTDEFLKTKHSEGIAQAFLNDVTPERALEMEKAEKAKKKSKAVKPVKSSAAPSKESTEKTEAAEAENSSAPAKPKKQSFVAAVIDFWKPSPKEDKKGKKGEVSAEAKEAEKPAEAKEAEKPAETAEPRIPEAARPAEAAEQPEASEASAQPEEQVENPELFEEVTKQEEAKPAKKKSIIGEIIDFWKPSPKEDKKGKKSTDSKAADSKDTSKTDGKPAAKTKTDSKPGKKAAVKAKDVSTAIPFTGVKDQYVEYNGEYYGEVIEIPAVAFALFSEARRKNSIDNALGNVLRSSDGEKGFNIVKLEKPISYKEYIDNEFSKLDDLKAAYEGGALSEDELKVRTEILYSRINDLKYINEEEKVIVPYYYLVFFSKNKDRLNTQVSNAMEQLANGEMSPRLLTGKELAIFLKYTNSIDFDESIADQIDEADLAKWAMPNAIDVRRNYVYINDVLCHNMRIVKYPMLVDDAWLARAMSVPATKVVIKATPVDKEKTIRAIDTSLSELRGTLDTARQDSKIIEAQTHIESLSNLLVMLQNDNETLFTVNIYISAYDLQMTRRLRPDTADKKTNLASISDLKKFTKSIYREDGMRTNNMGFNQFMAFVGSQISAYDPMLNEGRGIPSNTIAGAYPWIYAHVMDDKGVSYGSEEEVPVFLDFFARNSERVNSNMVIIGKSGSGKSYATKSILSNLAADNAKIFILDPENEYQTLAKNLHGKYINVGNAKYGRINPFQIIVSLDDEEAEEGSVSSSYSVHLQFLEEFFKQIMPDADPESLEFLNSLIGPVYMSKGIGPTTDLSKLKPEDYPTFDDLYDKILAEFMRTKNEFLRSNLRKIMSQVAKFAGDGRNAQLWNGPSSISTDENFTVFGFQSLLANRNSTIANAQMLLVIKYIDNEIIKNRDYNLKHNANRKIVVVIDEAHVFIDTKFPIALDFMFQLAKRIRKYNGMQIVITQNIKDFVGSEEIARKSTAIINACQYSLIFALAPNDMEDLCKLYSKAGGINENEQEQIVQAGRGRAFTIISPTSRSSFKVEVPDDVVSIFSDDDFDTFYYQGEEGAAQWESYIEESRKIREANAPQVVESSEPAVGFSESASFSEESEDEFEKTFNIPGVELEEVSELPTSIGFEEVEESDGTVGFTEAPLPVYTQTKPAADSSSADLAGQIITALIKNQEALANLNVKLSTDNIVNEVKNQLGVQALTASAPAAQPFEASGAKPFNAFDLEPFGETAEISDDDFFSSFFNYDKKTAAASTAGGINLFDYQPAGMASEPQESRFEPAPAPEPVEEPEAAGVKFSFVDYAQQKAEEKPIEEITIFTGDENVAQIDLETLIAYSRQQGL